MDVRVITPDKKELTGKAVRAIGEARQRDGKTYFTSHSEFDVPGMPPMRYDKLVRKDSKAFYSMLLNDGIEREEAEVVVPLKIGSAWETQLPMVRNHSVIGIETVKIGDKAYNDCFKIRSEAKEGGVETFWEAPNVGCVKSEIKAGGATITLTLRSFKAGK